MPFTFPGQRDKSTADFFRRLCSPQRCLPEPLEQSRVLSLISWIGWCPWMGQTCSRNMVERFLRQLCRWWISKSLQTFIGAKRVSHGFRGALNLIRGVNVVGSNLGFQWKSSDWMGKVIELKFTNCLFCHCLRMLISTCHAHQFFVMSFWLGACNRKALEVKH